MHEKEARARWCPFARTISYGAIIPGRSAAAVNRNDETGGPAHSTMCLASACAAWVPDFNQGNGHGFCGLVHRPR